MRCLLSSLLSGYLSNLLHDKNSTWYYAKPTMHQLILQTGRAKGYFAMDNNNNSHHFTNNTSLRMIVNTEGELLPAMAQELRHAFGGAHILPSYGMTKCMPFTSPPADYLLEKS